MFIKNLQMELAAIKMWEFTDEVKQRIWKGFEWDDEIKKDNRPFWNLDAELIIKGFENNTYDQLDSRYIADRAAYNFWKQYEAEWNKKYRSNE